MVNTAAQTTKNLYTQTISAYLPWWPSWLGRDALINVDAPGCGMSVVQGSTQAGTTGAI